MDVDIFATHIRMRSSSKQRINQNIGLRLEHLFCEPHPCPCGNVVDERGLHGLSCRRSAGRSTRHQHLNDVIRRVLRRADIPTVKERLGLFSGADLRPDGLNLR